MATNYTRWYRDGSVALTKNSTAVTGTSTYWGTANLNPGDVFVIGQNLYEIASITDNTHLTLKTAYTGDTASGQGYAIIRNFTASTQAKTAAQTAELLGDFARYIDEQHKTITGKSAYEVAKDGGYVGTQEQWLESLSAYGQAKLNGYTGTLAEWLDSLSAYGVAVKNGYTGTKAQWLESLKAAGEWTKADERLTSLEDDNTLNKTKLTAAENTISSHTTKITNAQTDINKLKSRHNGHYNRNTFIDMNPWGGAGNNLGSEYTEEDAKVDTMRMNNDRYALGAYWQWNAHIEFPILNGDSASNGDTYHDDYPIIFDGPINARIVRFGPGIRYGGEGWFGMIIMIEMNLAECTKNGATVPYGGVFPYNYKDSNECGYRYSLYYTKILPAIQTEVENFFGADRLKVPALPVTSGYGTAVFNTNKLILPSMSELVGDRSLTKKGFSALSTGLLATTELPQFPYYRLLNIVENWSPTRDMPIETVPNYNKYFLIGGGAYSTHPVLGLATNPTGESLSPLLRAWTILQP